MERAVAAFLEAAGLDATLDPNLKQTPRRVAEAWLNGFLDGYRTTPEEALGERYPVPEGASGELVVVTGLRYHSTCPHHLLPYQGRAHLAYVPSDGSSAGSAGSGGVVGFGRLAALLDCFAHRLILQEALAREVAGALSRVLRSPGAACVLEAEQTCLRARGATQCDAVTHAEAYEGVLRQDRELRRELWARIARGDPK
jgi:GTP cyclohydrolase I